MRKLLFTTFSICLLLMAGCNPEDDEINLTSTRYGERVSFGGGYAQSYVEMSGTRVTAYGIAISEATINSLPNEFEEVILPLPELIPTLPIKLIMMDFQPHGHEPPGVYDVPHFDFHFYKITNAERLAILPGNEEEFNNHPPAGYLPEDYVPAGPAPYMGLHWVDRTSPELQGEPFRHTFVYGTYNGLVTFYEPMAAISIFNRELNETRPIKQPQRFNPPGLYPNAYSIYYDARNRLYKIELNELQQR